MRTGQRTNAARQVMYISSEEYEKNSRKGGCTAYHGIEKYPRHLLELDRFPSALDAPSICHTRVNHDYTDCPCGQIIWRIGPSEIRKSGADSLSLSAFKWEAWKVIKDWTHSAVLSTRSKERLAQGVLDRAIVKLVRGVDLRPLTTVLEEELRKEL